MPTECHGLGVGINGKHEWEAMTHTKAHSVTSLVRASPSSNMIYKYDQREDWSETHTIQNYLCHRK